VLGLEPGRVRLVPYRGEWAQLFCKERARLLAAIGEYVLDIQHVGSTAIPGLPAKPILDIGVAVAEFEAARVCIAPLEALGYTYRGEHGIPRRHYFVREPPRTHHLHMHEIASPEWGRLVLFRDYLLAHPDVAEAYGALKRELARRHSHDRGAYTEAKTAFVENVLGRARGRPDASAATPPWGSAPAGDSEGGSPYL